MNSSIRWALILGLSMAGAAMADRDPARDLKKLVEEIARGSPQESSDATDELIAELITPLADAIGAIDARPVEQQRRILRAVDRLVASLRMRLFRASLSEDDRKLFDAFARRYADVAENLFHTDETVRAQALERIPLDAGTAAGLLIGSAVADAGEVGDAALRIAASFKDDVLHRTLIRFVEQQTRAIQSGRYGAGEEDFAIVYANTISDVIKLLADAGVKSATPAVVEALGYFPGSPYGALFRTGDALTALGLIGDETAAPLLKRFLDDRTPYTYRPGPTGKAAIQTTGDAALLALVRIYKLKPEQVGFDVPPEGPGVVGFLDESARLAGHRAFAAWLDANGAKPSAERAPLTTQPAQKP